MRVALFFISFLPILSFENINAQQKSFVFFYGDTIQIPVDSTLYVDYKLPIQETTIKDFYRKLDNGHIGAVVDSILAYKKRHDLDDWIYYHLIRATAEILSPKAQNYERYTLYKWFFLVKS